ncbi:MAG TPA: Hsp70 family protein, partial [Fibrobacteria bacterium]|nr:Hsp70 family protein [Fibrobacteria bacterium]
LKDAAEQAKIEVCRTRAASEIWIEGLCEDEDGKPVDFSFNLTPQDVQEVSRPFIERSLNLCRRTLKEKGISGQDLDRVLMVGGTTLNPWVREGVQSALNAKLDFSVDPVTAVARGAAIFAGIQTIPASAVNQTERKGKWTLNIEHVPVGDVVDPDIGGKVQGPQGESASGCTIEFVDTKTKWRSGRVPLNAQGAFLTQLFAEEKRRCEYDIELCNATGTRLEVSPARITYTIGVLPDKPPIANSIGIRLANGDMKHYLSKGTQLPARGSNEHRTTGLLRHGNEDDILRINVLEGEHSRADMNRSIGMLKIRGADIRRDLPAGSEIEVKLSMNESQQVRVHVFIPLLDEDFEAVFQLQSAAPELEELRARAADQKARLAKARDEAQRGEVVDARGALAQIEDENMENEVDHLLAAAEQDPDARSQLNRRLLDLAAATYEAEQAIAWPNLVDQAQTTHKEAADVIRDHGTDQEKRRIAELWDELQVAIGKKDAELVKRAKDECTEIMVHRLTNLSGFETMRFGWLEKDYEAGKMTDSQRAKALVERGRKLIADNNQGTKTIKEVEEELKVLNRQLASLLPSNTSTGPVTIEVQ